ncbi:acyltransferase [Desulfococcaceae bacterium OttesenSCG-928-F15]|nr:acyltransferase [Desulfococcaceae bacterium OttesenSCG-928-F15]
MFSSIIAPVRGCTVLLFLVLNTCIHTIPLLFLAVFKVIIPLKASRDFLSMLITSGIGVSWIRVNNAIFAIFLPTRFEICQTSELTPKGWYLVLCNHQSWVDILTLQKILFGKTSFLKFFIKQELIWVPLMGLAWWALDFPFMKRYSKAYLEKHPEKKGKDFEATRKACEKFQTRPVAVMNFAEGTRFSPSKKERQQSPYQRLLRPKAAGSALVLDMMGDLIRTLVDVTIAYPEGAPKFWSFLCGKTPRIRVYIQVLPIGEELIGDYFNDPAYREFFQERLNAFWAEKDARLAKMLQENWKEDDCLKPLD